MGSPTSVVADKSRWVDPATLMPVSTSRDDDHPLGRFGLYDLDTDLPSHPNGNLYYNNEWITRDEYQQQQQRRQQRRQQRKQPQLNKFTIDCESTLNALSASCNLRKTKKLNGCPVDS